MSIAPEPSKRVQATDPPCIVKTKALMAKAGTDVLSLAQGIVHWEPPVDAIQAATAALSNPRAHAYGPAEGLPELREALSRKLEAENHLSPAAYDVMVTAGANQAFTNLVLALTDAEDPVVLFKPYYFNHLMAIQMSGGARTVEFGPCRDDNCHPDLDWLEERLKQSGTKNKDNKDNKDNDTHDEKNKSLLPKMVVLINPNNPTGVLMTRAEVDRAASLCAKYGVWLVLDNTYEHFVYDEDERQEEEEDGSTTMTRKKEHYCASGSNVIHIFSFSKAFGMMGWRVGYLAYPREQLQLPLQQDEDEDEGSIGKTWEDSPSSFPPPPPPLASELLKVQDTIPICATSTSQFMALGALQAGRGWVKNYVETLYPSRRAVLDALSPLKKSTGGGITGGDGAIYVWGKLPSECQGHLPDGRPKDEAVVEWLVEKHRVCVIAGSACGCPGFLRVAYANLEEDKINEAARRLKRGLEELVTEGLDSVLRPTTIVNQRRIRQSQYSSIQSKEP